MGSGPSLPQGRERGIERVWVEELKRPLYEGNAKTLLQRLQKMLNQVPMRGPGTKGRRKALKTRSATWSRA